MPSSLRKTTLPTGHYYMLTMQVSDSFGGLTSAMLERARVFADIAGVPTTVLTVEARPSYKQVKARLVDEGRITDAVTMLNFHEDIRSRGTAPAAPRLDPAAATDGTWASDEDGNPFSLTLLNPEFGIPEQIFFTKADGTVYLIEHRDHDRDGARIGRRFTRFAETGSVDYGNAGSMYRTWFDEVRVQGPSCLIVDSKFSAIHFTGYQNKDVLKFHVVHGYHALHSGNPVTGKLVKAREHFLLNQDRWDGVICLTNRNRADLAARFGPTSNRFVISNIVARQRSLPAWSQRSRTRGVMVARMSTVKNIPVALAIIKQVHEQYPSVTLDIYGGGLELEKMEDLKNEMGLAGIVTLHGATPRAAVHFDEAAFTLLTSKSEMQPLVLMEAMGRGCPAVALDIRYGPQDLIRDGVTGFVVPADQPMLAADKVLEILRNPGKTRRMSRLAWMASSRFGAEAALSQWAKTIREARKNAPHRISVRSARLGTASPTQAAGKPGLHIPLTLDLARGEERRLRYRLIWQDRKTGVQHTARAMRRDGVVIIPRLVPASMIRADDEGPFDAYIGVSGKNYSRHLRIPVPESMAQMSHGGFESYRTNRGNWTLRRA